MSEKTLKKKGGRRKDKRLKALRADEFRRHARSGKGHRLARGEPHIGRTRRPQGHSLMPPSVKRGQALSR